MRIGYIDTIACEVSSGTCSLKQVGVDGSVNRVLYIGWDSLLCPLTGTYINFRERPFAEVGVCSCTLKADVFIHLLCFGEYFK